LKYLYKPKVELSIFGDINTDYLIKKKIASLLTTYSLSHTVNFATRIQNNSNSTTDNILVGNSRISLFSVFPIINGLLDHNAYILTIKNIYMQQWTNFLWSNEPTRLIDNETITKFQTLLKIETWEPVYIGTDSNHMFNSFLSTFINIFQASFPVKYRSMKDNNDWFTQGIKISSKQKRSLCALTKTAMIQKQKCIVLSRTKS
jgi:hypothetical protein